MDPVTNIKLYRDRQSVRFLGWRKSGARLNEGEESERFPTRTSAKRVLHRRYPQARIR